MGAGHTWKDIQTYTFGQIGVFLVTIQQQYRAEKLLEFHLAASAAHPSKETYKQIHALLGDTTAKETMRDIPNNENKQEIVSNVMKFAQALSSANKG